MPTPADYGRNHAQSALTAPATETPRLDASTGLLHGATPKSANVATAANKMANGVTNPLTPASAENEEAPRTMQLELRDGTTYQGHSFGEDRSISGELVFQTGMVGYPESITDPSYRGQILVITFPLVGNYGVPSRETLDELLDDLPAHFEASQIHIAGLVVASYSGEDYSHYLAESSLGSWLREQKVPAMYGVDTRALTKRIREEGSMLGRMSIDVKTQTNGVIDGTTGSKVDHRSFEEVGWIDPNSKNLVADGRLFLSLQVPRWAKSNVINHSVH